MADQESNVMYVFAFKLLVIISTKIHIIIITIQGVTETVICWEAIYCWV